MNEKKYLVWLDILGFDELARIIAKEKGIVEHTVRDRFIEVIKDKVEDIEARGEITGKKYGESDDWLLVTDDLNKVFLIIPEILDHNTGYKDYERIPLEIAIGTGEYDRWARLSGSNLIIENATIEFLKTNIVGYYHKWYRELRSKSIMSTFIVLTESAYQELKPLDKKICQKIEYEDERAGEKVIFFSADTDKFLLRAKGLKFVEKIGYPSYEDYARIYELYVPPIEYEEIKKTLNEKKIVFITGTPEYGKTYTAVKLMWDYYNMNYEPKWVKGGEPIQRIGVRERLEKIESELKPGCILYFEDPFGKVMYEKREGLEREIGVIIDRVRQANNVYVIITSREEVFKEFEKETLSETDIKEFEQKLNVKRPSYDYIRRKEILLKLAEKEGCAWQKGLKDFVLNEMENEAVLPTPLRIRHFATASLNVAEKEKLMQIILVKSEKTARVFAEEIQYMSEDKMLFLSFPFISSYFKIYFIRDVYNVLLKEMGLKGPPKGPREYENPWEFKRILNWFKDDKIRITQFWEDEVIGFSHPSYSEALGNLLVEDVHFKEIFSKLLFKLSDEDDATGVVAWAVAGNFERLSEDVRNLLFKLSERAASIVAETWHSQRQRQRLPEGLANLLFKRAFSIKEEEAWAVAWAVADNFQRLPEDARKKLLSIIPDVEWLIKS